MFITTSDGRIAFRLEDFRSMRVSTCGFTGCHEVIIWTNVWTGGRIMRYDSFELARKIGQEINEQLKKHIKA